MRTLLHGAVATGLLLCLGTWAHGDALKDLLDKAVKAHGGADKLAKIKAVQSKGKGRIELGGGIEFTQESSVLVPDKFKEVLHLTVMGQQVDVVVVYNGTQGWTNATGQGTKELTGAELDAVKDVIDMLAMARLAFLGGKDYELSPLGEVKVNDRPAAGVKVSRKGHKEVNLFFDKETNLLAKIEHRSKDPRSGQEFTEERIIVDYQDVNGVKAAKKAVINRDGTKYLEIEITEIKYPDKLNDSEFEKP